MATVELKRPELTDPRWKDKEGNSTEKGLVGEALKLSVSCNADMEEGAGVIFRVYPEGADVKRDQPVAEMASVNKNGTAEAEWTYRYVPDEEHPLTEKPKFFFTAGGRLCTEAGSGTVEIGMEINIPVCFDEGDCVAGLEYTLAGIDGTEKSGKTERDGRIQNSELLPADYEIRIDLAVYKPSESEECDTLDFDALPAGCRKIQFPLAMQQVELKLRPGRDYAILINKGDGAVSD
jgi:hypothetical protein